jgi:hypothetical protein
MQIGKSLVKMNLGVAMNASPIETVNVPHKDFDLLPTGVPICRPPGFKPKFGYSHLVPHLRWGVAF